jgi:hypothetical protein
LTESWLNYSNIAERLGTTAEAVRQKAIRGRWRRQRGNDGRALVLIDLDAEKAANAGKGPSKHPFEQPSDARLVEALQDHVATLQAELAQAEALAEQRQGEAEAARKRVDDLVIELLALSQALAERVRLDGRPWWRRWGGVT